MTEEKLAEEYAEELIKHKMAVHDVFDKEKAKQEIMETFLTGLHKGYNKAQCEITQCNRAALSGKTKWHKASEELPEERTDVLCYVIHNEHRFYLQGYYNGGSWHCTPLGTYLNDEDVKAWCKLPTYTKGD